MGTDRGVEMDYAWRQTMAGHDMDGMSRAHPAFPRQRAGRAAAETLQGTLAQIRQCFGAGLAKWTDVGKTAGITGK